MAQAVKGESNESVVFTIVRLQQITSIRPIRRLMRPLLVLAALLLAPANVLAQSVTVREGNLFYRASSDAAARQITSNGVDREPVLSPDGRTVAFVRGTAGDSVETATGQGEATSLWTIGVDGRGARMLVRSRAADDPEQALAAFQALRFSPDGRRIYFMSSAWVTSSAIHAVDVATGRERFVAPGNTLEVVPSGSYAGHLLVEQHRYFIAGGSYDWIWLLTPEGEVVGPVGEDESSLEQFRELYVTP
jgi:dipeptidyl aminopeptidase/acylaminoacyl peptidase